MLARHCVERQPLCGRADTARHPHTDHEAVGRLELLPQAFAANIPVVLLIGAVKLEQHAIRRRHGACDVVGQSLHDLAVTRKRDVDPVQQPLLPIVQPLDLIQEIAVENAVAEEQPVPSRRPHRLAFSQESPERRHASARPDHDQRGLGVSGQAKVRVAIHVDRDRPTLRHTVSEKGGGHALSRQAVALVAHDGDRQMHFIGTRVVARSDRIEARRQPTQGAGELCGADPRR